jgi:hypothetical protein
MIKTILTNMVYGRNYFIYKSFEFLSTINSSKFHVNSQADFVVSIASYPKRSHLLPAVFEALSKQTVVPKKWILVLSEEEWPNLVLPFYLIKLEKRGLEIIWVKNNTYAVKKLVPVLEKYPEFGVITFDDELIYGKHVIEKLISCSVKYKGSVIGHVGKQLFQKDGKLQMNYRTKKVADLRTPSEQVYFLGGSGTYYPANSLDKRVIDLDAIHRIVPGRGSDIWFWAAAIANDSKQVCIGSKTDLSLYFSVTTSEQTKPKDTPGADIMEDRFQKTVDFFGIRNRLLETLPNKKFS